MDYTVRKTSNIDSLNWTDPSLKKALVLMSGGVDSTAAAILLLKENYSLVGITMEIMDQNNGSATVSAASVCKELSIPHFSVDICEEFKNKIIVPFCSLYTMGLTPNPCAECNERIKFGLLWDIAEEILGSDFSVATGHYARIINKDGRHYLASSANKSKDQSYFLSGISREKISRILFPLGDFSSKAETRTVVRTYGLPVSERSESMEICFANENGYRSMIGSGFASGPIKDTSGRVLGEHNGISGYTLGQRKGLGIASKSPLYVESILPESNTIVAASREEAFRSEVVADRINILTPELLAPGSHFFCKIRSQGDPSECKLVSCSNVEIKVHFDVPIFAPAPGQRLVLYTAEGYVAAGGVIKESC